MGIWESLRRVSRRGKDRVSSRKHRRGPKFIENRGLRLEKFEERVLLSITPKAWDDQAFWDNTLVHAIERSIDPAAYEADKMAGVDTWVVGMGGGFSSADVAASLGADEISRAEGLPNGRVWRFPGGDGWQEVTQKLETTKGVGYFYPIVEYELGLRFTPNDPLFPDQWHLLNTGQSLGTPGADANVEPAWDSVTGVGTVIGVVDLGVEYGHPDLLGNYRADLSFDYTDYDTDPAPVFFEYHGTSVAGVAAAEGNNGVGVSGAAPGAEFSALRLLTINDLDVSGALGHESDQIDVYNNSWGPVDGVDWLLGPGPLTLATLEQGVTAGRGGLGNIYVWAGGNGAWDNDNVNYDGFANSRFTIAVGAIDHNGRRATYSEPGAPLLVSAYSSSGTGVGVTTTDLVGADG